MTCRSLWWIVSTLAAVGVGGCAIGPYGAVDTTASAGNAISLVYELPPAGAAALLASLERTTADREGAEASVRLQVVPADAHRVRAIATVTAQGRLQEAYDLILPAAELDLLVARLRHDQFPDTAARPGGKSYIELGFGSETIAKDWTPEPRLDDMAERTIRYGRRIPLDHRPVIGTAHIMATESFRAP